MNLILFILVLAIVLAATVYVARLGRMGPGFPFLPWLGRRPDQQISYLMEEEMRRETETPEDRDLAP